METLRWLKRYWLGAATCAYLVYRIMAEQGYFMQNALLLALLIAFAFRPKKSQYLPATLLGLLALAGILLYHNYIAPELFLRNVRQSPLTQFETVEAEVYLGGEKVLVMPPERDLTTFSSVATFHTDSGLTLATAHDVSYQPGDALVRLADSPNARTEWATILCNDFGVVFPTLRPPTGPKVAIANIDDIKLGLATVHRLGHPEIKLYVRGYYQLGELEFLVLQGDEPCRHGYSGSPILQNGKIIGSVYGYLKDDDHIWLARLATDLYQQASRLVLP
ncbi:MAG: hypothetical protein GX060_05530 [Firmicutes bacterium]|nr:hypothetical protein [Bacillota bacterium]